MHEIQDENLAITCSIEILRNIFNSPAPSQKEIKDLAAMLLNRNCDISLQSNSNNLSRNAVVLSANPLEQNVLTLMLNYFGLYVLQIYNSNDLAEKIFKDHHDKYFDFVFVSDYFEVGLNLISQYFSTYFQCYQIYIGRTPGIYAGTYRLDGKLEPFPFALKDLSDCLSRFKKN